jgi:hypothetical protein
MMQTSVLRVCSVNRPLSLTRSSHDAELLPVGRNCRGRRRRPRSPTGTLRRLRNFQNAAECRQIRGYPQVRQLAAVDVAMYAIGPKSALVWFLWSQL